MDSVCILGVVPPVGIVGYVQHIDIQGDRGEARMLRYTTHSFSHSDEGSGIIGCIIIGCILSSKLASHITNQHSPHVEIHPAQQVQSQHALGALLWALIETEI